MKIGTDSVLVGALADVPIGPCDILDIGTGCGVIAMMMAQRNALAEITAVEIDPEAASEASENFAASKFANRTTAIVGNIKELSFDKKFDFIICNPPYFKEQTQSPDANRATARHDSSLMIDDIMALGRKLLKPKGIFCFIYPAQRDCEVEFAASLQKCQIIRQLHISSIEGSKPMRTIWEFTCTPRTDKSRVIAQLAIRDGSGCPTSEYCTAVDSFYLKIS